MESGIKYSLWEILNNYFIKSGSHSAAQASPKLTLTLPQPPKKLGLQVHATVPSLVSI